MAFLQEVSAGVCRLPDHCYQVAYGLWLVAYDPWPVDFGL